MTSLLFSAPFLLFTLALIGMLLLALVETLGTSFQFSPAQWFELRLPRFMHRILSRLGAKEFPVFIFSIMFLLSLGITGYISQFLTFALSHHFLSVWALIIPVSLLSYFITTTLSQWLSQLMYSDASYFMQEKTNLLGRVATICRGDARPGLSAQARVRDQLGQLHYVEVEPEFGELPLHSEVILIARQNQLYLAKPLPHDNQLLNI